MIRYNDAVEWLEKNSIDDIIDAISDSGLEEKLTDELNRRASIVNAVHPGFNMLLREEFIVVVRSIKCTNNLGSMRLLRSLGHNLIDSKRLLKEAPFYFYAAPEYPTPKVYYDPRERSKYDGGESFQSAVSLGFNMLVISTLSGSIDEWIDTLTEDERQDVVFGLDFYIKLFNEHILISD